MASSSLSYYYFQTHYVKQSPHHKPDAPIPIHHLPPLFWFPRISNVHEIETKSKRKMARSASSKQREANKQAKKWQRRRYRWCAKEAEAEVTKKNLPANMCNVAVRPPSSIRRSASEHKQAPNSYTLPTDSPSVHPGTSSPSPHHPQHPSSSSPPQTPSSPPR